MEEKLAHHKSGYIHDGLNIDASPRSKCGTGVIKLHAALAL